MPIPESQLDTWSRQGAVTTAKATHESIRNALTAFSSPIRQMFADGSAEIYLQGSYKNDTNIRGDSDVDIVAELNTTFYSNLTEQEKQYLSLGPAVYSLNQFRAGILQADQPPNVVPLFNLKT
jgi:tRNA nucleotidyltransferase (CCA-adding enzyme)